MAIFSFIASTTLFLVLNSMTAFGDSDICSQVNCGKGTCQSKPEYIPYGYQCECDSGWLQTRLPDSEDQYLQFLPCTIPNCTINYSCMSVDPSPQPVPISPYNISVFNPCYWVYCGEGRCMKSSDNTHLCQCRSGAYNLLNVSHFPCYKDCAVGSDCSKLGIGVPRESDATSSGSGSTQDLSSGPTSASGYDGSYSRKFSWMISAMISLLVISRQ